MIETPRATTARAREAQARESDWRPVRRAAVLMLRRAAPWVLVVLVVLSALGNALVTWGVWSGAPPGDFLGIQGDQGIAAIVAVPVGLAVLLVWARTVRTALPVLVAGGVTRRAVTGGLLLAVVTLALVTTALLALVAVAGAALQLGVARIGPGQFQVLTDGSAFASALTFAADAPETYLNPAATFPWLVLAALTGVLLGAAWSWRRVRAVVCVLLGAGVVGAVYLRFVVAVPIVALVLLNARLWLSVPLVVVACLALAVAVWLVLRRVPLRPPAR